MANLPDTTSAADILAGLPNRINEVIVPYAAQKAEACGFQLEALPAASTGKIFKHKLWEAAQTAQARVASLPKQVRTLA